MDNARLKLIDGERVGLGGMDMGSERRMADIHGSLCMSCESYDCIRLRVPEKPKRPAFIGVTGIYWIGESNKRNQSNSTHRQLLIERPEL